MSGLTDGEGRLTGTYRYTASGELSYGGARYENEYTYNGESYNPNVECQYLRARYYSVARGSFLTQDSYLGELWQPLTWNRYNYCVSSWPNYRDPSGHSPYDYTGPGPADMMELWSLLTGEQSYQEQAQEYRELQMELEYYEGSASAGMFDSLVSHVGHEVIGIANTAISASNAFWKAVHWFNIPAKLYGLEAPETELISTAPFDTYLEKNAARIWDMDVYYAGRCGGDVIIGAVDLAAMVKGLANLPGALEDLLNGIGSLSGGSPQLQLVGGSAQAAADGSGVISGLAGIGWGSIPALLFGDAGEDFLNSFAKIDRDRLLGSESGTDAGNKITKSEHAELRGSQGRNVNTAINDLNKTQPSNIYLQDDGRYVIKGSNGRVHIMEPDGEIVTTMNNVTNFNKRISSGRYMPLTEAQKADFAQKFGSYLNDAWSSYK